MRPCEGGRSRDPGSHGPGAPGRRDSDGNQILLLRPHVRHLREEDRKRGQHGLSGAGTFREGGRGVGDLRHGGGPAGGQGRGADFL